MSKNVLYYQTKIFKEPGANQGKSLSDISVEDLRKYLTDRNYLPIRVGNCDKDDAQFMEALVTQVGLVMELDKAEKQLAAVPAATANAIASARAAAGAAGYTAGYADGVALAPAAMAAAVAAFAAAMQ